MGGGVYVDFQKNFTSCAFPPLILTSQWIVPWKTNSAFAECEGEMMSWQLDASNSCSGKKFFIHFKHLCAIIILLSWSLICASGIYLWMCGIMPDSRFLKFRPLGQIICFINLISRNNINKITNMTACFTFSMCVVWLICWTT